MKTNSKNMFEVICGSYRNHVRVDREVFESYEDACFEAATQSLEEYFGDTNPNEAATISIFCVIRTKHTHFFCGILGKPPAEGMDNDFVILTHNILRNAGHHDLANEFERASDSYLSTINKKEK